MKQIDDITIKMDRKNETGMVSPPQEASKTDHKPVTLQAIEAILGLVHPCEVKESDFEYLCEDCPFDIAPKVDCGLALLQERAKMIKLELVKNE